MSEELKAFMRRIGYTFSNQRLLDAALTHRSVRGNNNERLEFLGDAILNFIIAEALYQKFSNAREGDLSRLRASLVKGETLTYIAKEFKISDYIKLGVGELKSGGAFRESILADAVEAIIGAIYLDVGFDRCRELVLQWYEERLQLVSPKENLRDPKTQLQEYLQAKKMPLPIYDIVKIEGEAHSQTFFIKCSVAGLNLMAEGMGSSRRKAEQTAASKLLLILGVE